MSYEMVKEKLTLDQNIGKETSQILLEGDIIVPDVKPDMLIMLQADAQISIDKIEPSQDRVNYMGKLDIQVLYISKTNDKSIYSMNVVAPIDDFINIEGLTKDMWVEVKSDIQNIDYNMINDRKISYRAVIDIKAVASELSVHEVVVNIDNLPQNQQKKIDLTLNRGIVNRADRFIIKDTVNVSSGKPNIREILQTNIDIANQEIKIGNGKVNIIGELVLTLLYKGDTDESVIEFIENEIPFNGMLDISEVRDNMFVNVTLSLQDKYIQVRQDDDGEDRIVDLEAVIGAIVRVSVQEKFEVLEDAHCINQNLVLDRNKILYPKLICRNKNQNNIKEIVQLDDNCPEILQIFKGKGKVHLDDINIIKDKIIVEGVIETNILYVAKSDETPLYSYKTMIPYRQVIETKGSLPDMDVNVDVIIDHVGFNILSGKEIELRFIISFNTEVFEEDEVYMIKDIQFVDLDQEFLDKLPSIGVYIVQPGDSLWKIAKMYNTSIDEIATLNEIDNVDKIYPGQKLIIAKNVTLV